MDVLPDDGRRLSEELPTLSSRKKQSKLAVGSCISDILAGALVYFILICITIAENGVENVTVHKKRQSNSDPDSSSFRYTN